MTDLLFALALSLLVQSAVTAPDPGRVTWGALRSARGADSPAGAIREYARAYSALSVERLGALLTADFRSHLAGQDSLERRFPEGIDRAHEMSVIRGLLRGGPVPPARKIRVKAQDLVEGADPEHPDSTDQYRLVAIQRFTFDIEDAEGMEFRGQPALHIVHLVRGDAGVLVPGQPADPRHWYIRRWLEDVNGLATRMEQVAGDCSQEDAPASAAALALAIRPLTNPACPALDLTCTLPEGGPARLEVFDLMGRRVNRQELPGGSAGPRHVQAGAGVSLMPGAYWVRLAQAGHHITRMVIVAR